MNAIIFAAAWLIYVLSQQVVTAQKDMSAMLSQHQVDTAMLKADAADAKQERKIHTSLLRQICIGVTKGVAQGPCGADH